MRLIEEKRSVGTNLIMLLLIVLTGIGIQFCESRIADYDADILKKMLHVNRIESERINQNLSSARYLVAAHANAAVDLDTTIVTGGSNRAELLAIIQERKEGKLNDRDYCNKMATAHSGQAEQIAKKYQGKLAELREKLNKGTSWELVKRLLVILQVLAVVVAAISYTLLLKSIGSRIREKVSCKPEAFGSKE